MISRGRPLYEGKAKIIFPGPQPGTLIQHFKDDATAFNRKKTGVIVAKGVLNNRISEHLMQLLGGIGIPTHFLKSINMREQLIHKLEMFPLEVLVRNVVAGSMSTRFGIEEGTPLSRSIVEFCLKDDDLGDPFVSEEHITAFGWAQPQEVDDILALSLRINDFLQGVFSAIGIRLIDFKLEFGRYTDNNGDVITMLGDEISPDTCRLWDAVTQEKLDKDRFRYDLGGVEDAYREVASRLKIFSGREQRQEGGQEGNTEKTS